MLLALFSGLLPWFAGLLVIATRNILSLAIAGVLVHPLYDWSLLGAKVPRPRRRKALANRRTHAFWVLLCLCRRHCSLCVHASIIANVKLKSLWVGDGHDSQWSISAV